MPEPVRPEVDGVTYRVFDATMRDGKLIVANPPAAWATSRVIRPAKGHRRLYRLKEGADRATEDAALKEADRSVLAAQDAAAELVRAALGPSPWSGSRSRTRGEVVPSEEAHAPL